MGESLYHTSPKAAAKDFFENSALDDVSECVIYECKRNELDFSPSYQFDRIMEDLDDANTFYELAPSEPHPEIVKAWNNFVKAVQKNFKVTDYERTGNTYRFKYENGKITQESI